MTQQTRSQAAAGARTIPEWFLSDPQPGGPRRVYHHTAGRDLVWNPGRGGWVPTQTIADWLIGEAFELEPCTEAQARAVVPAAFT